MKKILTLCVGVMLVFGLCACNESTDLPGPGTEEEPEPEVTEPGPETGGDGNDGGEIGGEEEPNPSDPSSELLNFESVSFVDSPYILEVGATRDTQLEIKPEGIDVSVTYTAKEALIASIDTDGVITGIGVGETEVYATVSAEGYNDAIATAEVKVEAQYVETDYVKSITFLESSGYTLKVGDTYDFKDTNGVYVDVSGSASQEFALECDIDGYTDYFTISGTSITAVKVTDSPITLKAIATGDTSKTAETTVTITGEDEIKVTGITVNEKAADSSSVKWGGSYSATIAVTPTNASNTDYEIASDLESSNQLFNVAKDESTVTFTHKGEHAGTEVFTITPADGSSVSCTLTLTAEKEIVEPQGASFENLAGTYEITDTLNDLDTYLNLDWQVEEDNDHTHDTVSVLYASSNTGVVSITGSEASIVGTGEATITATVSSDNLGADLTATAAIVVQWTATEMTIDHETLTLTEGDEETLSVTFGPSGYTVAPNVTWSITSGENYVSLSETTGNSITVTANEAGAGSATITASAEGCTSVSCTVTVEAKAVYESTTFTITINGSNGTAFPDVPEGVSVYLGTDCFNTTWQYYVMTYTSSSVYTYTTTDALIAGSHYLSIYAYNGSGNIYDHEIGSGYQITIAGTETGEVSVTHTYQISYSSWDDIFPTHEGNTSFYILAFDKTDTTTNFGNLNYLESDSTYFSGSKEVSVTKGTATSGQHYVYNSVAGTASAEDRTNWFTFCKSSSDWSIQCSCGTLEIPDSDSGYAVYVCVNDDAGCVQEGGYSAWTPYSGVPTGITLTNGWATGVESITAFIANFTSWLN